jgi:hypothetical protein
MDAELQLKQGFIYLLLLEQITTNPAAETTQIHSHRARGQVQSQGAGTLETKESLVPFPGFRGHGHPYIPWLVAPSSHHSSTHHHISFSGLNSGPHNC